VGIDASIAAEIAAGKFREIDAIMQDRPQHPIGEAVVIFLIVGFAEVGDNVGHVTAFKGPGGDVSLG